MYKRQVLVRNDAQADQLSEELDFSYRHDTLAGLANRSRYEADLRELPNCGYESVAVSYTHLDAYKRQAGAVLPLAGAGGGAGGRDGPVGVEAAEVVEDVYKRQGRTPCRPARCARRRSFRPALRQG